MPAAVIHLLVYTGCWARGAGTMTRLVPWPDLGPWGHRGASTDDACVEWSWSWRDGRCNRHICRSRLATCGGKVGMRVEVRKDMPDPRPRRSWWGPPWGLIGEHFFEPGVLFDQFMLE